MRLSIVSDINTCTENKSGCVKHFTVQNKYICNAIDFLQFICTCILESQVVECSKEGGGGGGIEYLSLNMNVMQVI